MDFISARRHSPTAVAQLAQVHVATVWRWILRGVRGRKLPSIIIGGRRYILESDLRDFSWPVLKDIATDLISPIGPPSQRNNSMHAAFASRRSPLPPLLPGRRPRRETEGVSHAAPQ